MGKLKVTVNFESAAAYMRNGPADRVALLREVMGKQLEKIGVEPGGEPVVADYLTTPSVNTRSLLRWIDWVPADDAEAVDQLKRLHATASSRG